ncbi:MurR/RpiR family transcriptional regulator [Ureibacillus sp. 179-F W5.1 NHS]|uniref:MurR/RpiR family transcriptional regulator n=1 Tax=Lysinibacillus halotolerans TaxID=1368476 RepID=A0A3M8H8X4_9BACI|nr:MurR/RpiR family transcriptional regulator [Lysinibacillus halotolerans]RNC98769.1 MurR/RpiR family transcriptional regulator [Lysinibacillus halotolerans]
MSFCDEIKKRFIRLSRGQRKVAQFVIDNPNIIATHIASDVGKQIGISESTVIRFCYSMDLSGYLELQEKIKEDLLKAEGKLEYEHPLISKKHEHFLSEVMNRDIKSILNTIHVIDEKQFEYAIRLMHESNYLYVLGFRQSSPSASFVTCTLSHYRKHVKQIEHDVDNIVQQISAMDEESLLILIALDGIHEDDLTTIQLAKNKNVKVIAITNTTISPINDYVDVLFKVGGQKQETSETIMASHSLIHALVEGMVAQNRSQYTKYKKTNQQDSYLKKANSM